MKEAARESMRPHKAASLLCVDGLAVSFGDAAHRLAIVRNATFDVARGEVLGLVGESGSGKSVSCMAITRLLGADARVEGSVLFDGAELVGMDEAGFHKLRGRRIAVVFQDAVGSLNPIRRVRSQLHEIIRLHQPGIDADAHARELLSQVGIADVERCMASYPFMLSGGMSQRVMIAAALAGRPDLLIADEPTTALDVTTQAQILDLLLTRQREDGMAMIIVTHDLGVVARVCDSVAVMYAGRVVERASAEDFFRSQRHPYAAALLEAMPGLSDERGQMRPIEGVVPPIARWDRGCTFAPRCPRATALCAREVPAMVRAEDGRAWACHHPLREVSDVA